MARNGVTSTTEHTYDSSLLPAYVALAQAPDCPLRLAYERALAANRLTGTDHRWRLEHCGGGRGDQFARAARMGVAVSLLPAQFIYWGDLLDGTMFAPEIGSQWVRAGDAVRAGASVSFHNDGCVSPPIPLLNVQSMVTRRTLSGNVHGANQAVTLHDAFRAHTREAAFQIGRDHDLGSIEVGKAADFVELSADPFTVDVNRLTDLVQVKGTWRGGHRIDLDRFLQHIQSLDPATHRSLVDKAAGRHVCSHGGHGCEHEPGAN